MKEDQGGEKADEWCRGRMWSRGLRQRNTVWHMADRLLTPGWAYHLTLVDCWCSAPLA